MNLYMTFLCFKFLCGQIIFFQKLFQLLEGVFNIGEKDKNSGN